MVAKMARAFGVTVDFFLIGEGENASYDKETVERINDIQKMDDGTKSVLFNVIRHLHTELQDQKGIRQIKKAQQFETAGRNKPCY